MAKITKKYWLNHKIIDGEVYRQCTKCKQWLLENRDNFYYTNKNKGDFSFSSECIECRRNRSNIYFHNNIEKDKERSQRKDVKAMRNKIHKKWRKEHKEEWQEYFKEYLHRPETKYKLKEYGQFKELNKTHKINKKEWEACKEYFKNENGEYCCAYCNKPISQNTRIYAGKSQQIDLHKEHVNHNGTNDLSNCVPSCHSCNSNKWIFDMEKWYKGQEFFSQERLDKIHKWLQEDYKLYIEKHKPKQIYIKKNLEYWENKSKIN